MQCVIETFSALPDFKWDKISSLKIKFKDLCYNIPISVEDHIPDIVFDGRYTIRLDENGEVEVEIDPDSRIELEKREIIIPFWEECLKESINEYVFNHSRIRLRNVLTGQDCFLYEKSFNLHDDPTVMAAPVGTASCLSIEVLPIEDQ